MIGEESSNIISKNNQKIHPRLLNPAQTIKIIPSKNNEIKEIKEEAIEESMDNSQLKKHNLKLIIPDNSTDEIEPSTSGSKNSQNTPLGSPLVNIEKNKKNQKFFGLINKDSNNNEEEDIMKCTPHFIDENNENKASYESAIDDKNSNKLKIPITPNSETEQKIKPPLTGNNKGYGNYKFTFNFETKENGVIIPKFGEKNEEKKIVKITNGFRIANKNSGNIKNNGNKNKFININKHFDCNKKMYTTKDVKCMKNKNNDKDKINTNEKDNSPLNLSINSLKCNEENQSKFTKNGPNYINEKYNTEINNNKRRNIFDTRKRIRRSRPKSGKNISPKKQSLSKNRIVDSDKEKDKFKERKKSCVSSNKKTLILPYLNENRNINLKNKLENEFSNLFKILPENYQEDSEINNQINLIINDINELKECIYKNNKSPFRSKRNFSAKSKK